MSSTDVSIQRETVIIPTYPVGPAERNPMFYDGRCYQGAKGPMYPYPLLDKRSDVLEERSYEAVHLENRYVEFCGLPEIGGRCFTAVDKTNGYDFFYRQHVLKPALIGMVGAWTCGGAEWNVVHHHRVSTYMPVDFRAVDNPDGSKTLWVGEFERRHRMRWIVGMTLRPDFSYLEVTVKLFNRTPYAHSFLYFSNVGVSAGENYQVIFPPSTRCGTQHAKCEFIHWPIAHEHYAGVDYSADVDVSWWKNHPGPLSIFAWDSKEDFFGGYDHGAQAGTCHVADHHVMPGQKFFTFANGDPGRMWEKTLTDEDGPYLELMAGAYSDNQPDYSWIQPGETKTVTEYWYPVRDLGGIKNANKDAAVNLEVDDRNVAAIAFNTTSQFRDATVLLRAGEKLLFEQKATIAPDKPFRHELALGEGVSEWDLRASLICPSGRELIAYRPVRREDGPLPSPVEPPQPVEEIESNEELYLTGLRLEQFHNATMEPTPYYEEILKRDPGDSRANVALGLGYLKRGMFDEAVAKLTAATARVTKNYTRPKDGEAHYYLGVALKAQHKLAAARDELNKAAWSFAWRSASRHALAEIAACEGDLDGALASGDEAIAHNALNVKALNLKAAVLRRQARLAEAQTVVSAALEIDPLDFYAVNEQVLILREQGDMAQAQTELDRLRELMRDEAQSYLELSWDYAGAGLWDEAIDALSRLIESGNQGASDPMVHYTLGHFLQSSGDATGALEHYRLGGQMSPEYCFPFRLESIEVLRDVTARQPEDARAWYYLGNLLYDIQPGQAVQAWERSAKLDDSFSIVHRNLGLAYARVDEDHGRAIACLEKAIACDPSDAMVYHELDELYEGASVDPGKRLSLLADNYRTIASRPDTLLRLISLQTLFAQYDRAVELLDSRKFRVWEGYESHAHDVYVMAHLLRGQTRMRAGLYDKALADYQAALEYPERFGYGRPLGGARDAEVFYHIGTAQEALGDCEQAKASFERAANAGPASVYMQYYEGLAHRKLGREDKANELFEKLIEAGNKHLAASGKVDFFEKFAAGGGSSLRQAQIRYMLGLGFMGKEDLPAAKRELQEALKLNPSHLGARFMCEQLG